MRPQGEGNHPQARETGLCRNLTCPHLDLGLSTSRPGRKSILIVAAIQAVEFGGGSLSKHRQASLDPVHPYSPSYTFQWLPQNIYLPLLQTLPNAPVLPPSFSLPAWLCALLFITSISCASRPLQPFLISSFPTARIPENEKPSSENWLGGKAVSMMIPFVLVGYVKIIMSKQPGLKERDEGQKNRNANSNTASMISTV